MGSHMESQADIMRRDPGLECESQADLSPFEYGKRDSAAMAATTRTMKQFKSRLTIAFVTCNSNLVPLLEGLCSSNPCRFELWII